MLKLDHIGIAVKSIDHTLDIYTKMGDFEIRRTEVPGQKVKIAMLKSGETSVELLEPSSEDSSLAKFLSEKGEGLHHIAFEVDNIDQSTAQLRERGYRFIYDKAADGKFGSKVNFIHPRSAGGVLVELTQNKHL